MAIKVHMATILHKCGLGKMLQCCYTISKDASHLLLSSLLPAVGLTAILQGIEESMQIHNIHYVIEMICCL